jgi:hypothetical protein
MTMTRRAVLRGVGAAVALPFLESLSRGNEASAPRRIVAICTNMGLMPRFFFPEAAGSGYAPTPYLEILKDLRPDFTVFSGLSHPQVDGAHNTDLSFLTAAPHPGRGEFRNTISVDQVAAERIGVKTRFPYLALAVGPSSSISLSWNASGVPIPGEGRPSRLFQKLFLQGTPEEVEAQVRGLRAGRSILDAVADRAKALASRAGTSDRDKLDQYFSSVRQLEGRLVEVEAWERKPKPKVATAPPEDAVDPSDLGKRSSLMLGVARLALQTDSTRLVTLMINQNTNATPRIEGVHHGHHSLTHHGNRPETVEELRRIESAQMRVLRDFLLGLKSHAEEGATLLDRTMVLFGSNLGNASTHDTRNLPILLAGGGFRHGGHLAFDRDRNTPLCDLFVTMLRRMGLEIERFASSTGTLRGLEVA